MTRALLIMAKRPFPGRTKTRFSPPFSLEQAAKLYECFLKDTCDVVRSVSEVSRFVAVTPPEAAAYFAGLAPEFQQVMQVGETLSERLDHVMTRCSEMGFDQVVAINSDSPTLPAAYLIQAFSRLDDPGIDVVLGPCSDGGYYLIGWKQPNARLVRDVHMSTSDVLQDTLRIAEQEGLCVSLLPAWYDVDTSQDLLRVERELAEFAHLGHHTRRYLAELSDSQPDFLGPNTRTASI